MANSDYYRGRTEAQACKKCQVIAAEVQDMELNREIFDIDTTEEIETINLDESIETKEAFKANESPVAEEEEIIQVIEEELEAVEAVEATKTSTKQNKRRFDSVRNLLEKARHKLMTTRQFWSRSLSRNRAQSQGPEISKACKAEPLQTSKDLLSIPNSTADSGIQSQSSPNTPAQLRKEKRHRSFSPVR